MKGCPGILIAANAVPQWLVSRRPRREYSGCAIPLGPLVAIRIDSATCPRISSREAWRRGLKEPPELAAIGTRGEVDVFGEWVGFEVAAEPLHDPQARASAHD
jgi:hypothetical protein